MNGKEIVSEWKKNQLAGKYSSYKESMDDLANIINNNLAENKSRIIQYPNIVVNRQTELRNAGFNSYNCDEIDEFVKF